MTKPLIPAPHHHPVGMVCVVCVLAGIDVAPTEVQAARISLAERVAKRAA